MNIRRLAATAFAAVALLAGSTAAASAAPAHPDFRKEALTMGLSTAQASSLQHRVDEVLAGQPGGRQVSATEVDYDGLTVTFDPRYSEAAGAKNVASPSLTCSYGWLCMTVRGTNFSYYTCQTWTVSNWYGTGVWINNQTPGTVARFYGQNGNQIWTSTAYSSGTADWAPVWSLRPC